MSEWFGGKDASVPLFDLEQLYSPEGAAVDVSMAKTFAPVAAVAPASVPVSKPVAPVDTKVAASAPAPAAESLVRPPSPVKQDPAPQSFETLALKKVARPPSPVKPEPPKAGKPVVNTKTDSPVSPVHVQVCIPLTFRASLRFLTVYMIGFTGYLRACGNPRTASADHSIT